MENLSASPIETVLPAGPDGKIGLVITDTGAAENPQHRYERLLAKVKECFQAVHNGVLEQQHPGVPRSAYYIKVICATRPTAQMYEITRLRAREAPEAEMVVQFARLDGRLWPGAKFEIRNAGEIVPAPSEEMWDYAKGELEFAFETIRSKHFLVFSSWLERGEKHLSPNATPGEEAILEAQEQARQLSYAVTLHAIVYDATLGSESGEKEDVLLARVSERERAKGVMFGLKYQPGKWLRKARQIGQVFVVGECESDLEG